MTIISNRWTFLALACLAELLALTTWFSATAIMPELQARWQLGGGASAWLTNGRHPAVSSHLRTFRLTG